MMVWYKSRWEIENDPSWKPSLGDDITKLHWRKGRLHATCRPNETMCEMHEDKYDPHDFPTGTVKHLWDWNKLGAMGIGIITLYALDQLFNDGRLARKVKRELGI